MLTNTAEPSTKALNLIARSEGQMADRVCPHAMATSVAAALDRNRAMQPPFEVHSDLKGKPDIFASCCTLDLCQKTCMNCVSANGTCQLC